MENIIYTGERTRKWLSHDKYKGYEYVIMTLGTHPVAYINIPENNKYFNVDYPDIDCHGGCTYSSKYILDEDGHKYMGDWWIGWDYAHIGDYIKYPFEYNLTTFTTGYTRIWNLDSITEEVKRVIDSFE